MVENHQGRELPYADRLRAANIFVEAVKDYHRVVSDQSTPIRRLLPGENVPAVQTLLRHPTATGMRNYVATIAVPLGIENSPDYDIGRHDAEEIFSDFGFYPQRVPYGDVYYFNWASYLMRYRVGLNELKRRTVGHRSPSGAQNFMGVLTSERAAWLSGMARYGDLKDDPEIPRRIETIGSAVMQQKDIHLSTVGVTIYEFGNHLRNVSSTLQHLEHLPGFLTVEEQRVRIALGLQTEVLTPEMQTEQLRKTNDALFARTRELQQYGVKSAVAPSLLPAGNRLMNEWLVVDPDTEQSGLLEATGEFAPNQSAQYLSRPAATFYGTANRFVSSNITYGMGDTKFPHQEIPFAGAEVGAITEKNGEPGMAIVLGRDGQLKTIQGFDLREYIEHAGLGLFELEVMRAELLSIYADLVTPIYVNDLATHHAKVLRAEQHGKSKEEPTMRELVLARTRVIDVFHDDIVNDLQKEEDTNTVVETISDTKQRRILERHTVVGHTRRIPATHRASPLARANALKEADLVLPEYGLTWEKKHEKGKGASTSLGHKADLQRPSPPREEEGVDFVDLDRLATTIYEREPGNGANSS